MSLFSLIGNTLGEVSIVLDIGCGTVGGAIVRGTSGHAPEILYTYRESTIFDTKPDSEKLIAEMLRALEKVCSKISHDGVTELNATHGPHKIRQIHYVFSAPWIIAQTKKIRYNNKENLVISRAMIDSIIKNDEKEFERTKNTPDFAGEFGADTARVEHKAIQMTLNGYETSHPVGKKAQTIEMFFYTSAIGSAILDTIQQTVAKFFNFRKGTTHSFTLLSSVALRDVFSSEKNFLTIDISGELTAMSIVKNGVALHDASFPFGTHTVIRALSSTFGLAANVSESMIALYLHDKTDPELNEKCAGIFADLQRQWLELLHQSLAKMGNDFALPKTLFFIVSSKSGMLFADFLRTEKRDKLGLSDESFSIVVIDDTKLDGFCHFSPKATADTVLALETVALGKHE